MTIAQCCDVMCREYWRIITVPVDPLEYTVDCSIRVYCVFSWFLYSNYMAV